MVEGDETIVIPGTTTVSGLSVTSATITLTDDDKSTTPTDDKDSAELSISGPAANVSEGSDATFTVTLSAAVAAQVQVAWSAPLGTDAAGSADLDDTSGTVTFAANSAAGATQTITITATDDALSETAESFTVTLGTITSTVSSQISLKSGASAATATIAESDPITINISGPSDRRRGRRHLQLHRLPLPLRRHAHIRPDRLLRHVQRHRHRRTDYTAKSGTLTFTQRGGRRANLHGADHRGHLRRDRRDLHGDDIESVGRRRTRAEPGDRLSVTTTITDDDAAPTGITLSSASPNSLGRGRHAPRPSRDGHPAAGAPADGDRGDHRHPRRHRHQGHRLHRHVAGHASPSRPTAPAAPARSPSRPTDDQVVEGDETISIPGTTTVSGLSVTAATVTLTDDDKSTTTPGDKDTAELSITGPASNVAPRAATPSFTVTLSAAVAAEVQSGVERAAGDRRGGKRRPGRHFGHGDLRGELGGRGHPNDHHHGHRRRALGDGGVLHGDPGDDHLDGVVADLAEVGASAATATIAERPDHDQHLRPVDVDEGDATTNYTVSLSPSGVTPTSDLTVSYATSNGTATAGSDYTAKSGTLTFTHAAAGSQTFTVQTTEDTVDEGTG